MVVQTLKKFLTVVAVAVVSNLLPLSSVAAAESRYIVYPTHTGSHLAARLSSSSTENAVEREGVIPEQRLELVDGVVVSLTDSEANNLAAELAGQGYAIEPDYPVEAVYSPNDPQYAAGNQGDMVTCRANEAWDVSTGSSGVVVGVLDTGIDYTHPDLAANIWTNSGEIAGNGIDDDSNGYVDDYRGWDAYNNDGDPYDDQGHGTHVAGTIGAVGNNGVGVAGINWNVKMVGLKVLSSGGSGYTSGLIAGIQYAIVLKQRGVNLKVINASLGGGGYSTAFQLAITQAYNLGILFVAAAGNSALNNDTTAFYPANYNNVLSVAAITNSGSLASFSNYGATKVQIAAPGYLVRSTYPLWNAFYGGYRSMSGTSMAAPHVAGAAALVAAVYSNYSAGDIYQRLLASATVVSGLVGKVSTGAMLNVAGAVALPQHSISGQVTVDGAPLAGVTLSSATLGSTTTDANGNYSFTGVANGSSYSITASLYGYAFTPATAAGTISGDTTVNFEATISESVPGSYTLSGRVINANGNPMRNVTVSGTIAGVEVSVVTNKNGRFSFSNILPTDEFSLEVTHSRYRFLPSVIEGSISENTNVTIRGYKKGSEDYRKAKRKLARTKNLSAK